MNPNTEKWHNWAERNPERARELSRQTSRRYAERQRRLAANVRNAEVQPDEVSE